MESFLELEERGSGVVFARAFLQRTHTKNEFFNFIFSFLPLSVVSTEVFGFLYLFLLSFSPPPQLNS